MCLAVPAKITEIVNQTATVEIGGITKQASLVLLPGAAEGDYVLIHAGFAISVVDEQEAHETIRLFGEMLKGMGHYEVESDELPRED